MLSGFSRTVGSAETKISFSFSLIGSYPNNWPSPAPEAVKGPPSVATKKILGFPYPATFQAAERSPTVHVALLEDTRLPHHEIGVRTVDRDPLYVPGTLGRRSELEVELRVVLHPEHLKDAALPRLAWHVHHEAIEARACISWHGRAIFGLIHEPDSGSTAMASCEKRPIAVYGSS